jgi:hypothetical protein
MGWGARRRVASGTPSRSGRAAGLALAFLLAASTVGWISDGTSLAAAPAELISVDPGTGGPLVAGAGSPSVSGDGNIVVFNSSTFDAATGVIFYNLYVRNRATGTTATVPGLPPEFVTYPGTANGVISRDGCHVAFWGRDYFDFAAGQWNIYSWNRCSNGGAVVVGNNVDPNPGDYPGPIDVSADGRYIAYISAPAGVPHIARIDTVAATESALPINPGFNIADSISISDDGKFVAVGEQRTTPGLPPLYQVVGWRAPCTTTCATEVVSLGSTGQPASGFNDYPSVSADGRYVAFVSDTPDVLGSAPASNQVYVRDRVGGVTKLITDTPGKPMIPTGIGMGEPDISPDGTQIALTEQDQFENSQVWVARSTSGYFDTAAFDLVSYGVSGAPAGTSGAGASSPSMSATGRSVAFSSYAGDELSGGTVPAGTYEVWMRSRPIQLGSTPSVSFGTVDIGSQSPAKTAVITNTSAAEVNLGSVTVAPGPFSITANTCTGVLPAGATCTVTMVFKPTVAGPATANLVVTGDGLSTTTSLTGTGRTPTTTTLPTAGVLKIKPTSVSFGSAVVGTALPAKSFVVSNSGQSAVTITGVALGAAGADQFSIDSNGCTGALAPAATCTIQVSATVTRQGSLTATLTVSGAGGQSATATLRLGGEFTPTLKMNPGVVSTGKITSAIGSGFPPNIDVDLALDGEAPFVTVHTDAEGSFKYDYLLVTAVRIGGREVLAVDQPQFSGVRAPLLIELPKYRPSGFQSPQFTQGVRSLVYRAG